MKTINLNLATFEYQDKRIAYPILIGAALIIIIISGFSVQFYLGNQNDIKEYEKKIARLEQEHMKRQKIYTAKHQDLDSGEIEAIQKEIDFVNELITKDTFPWDKLMNSLERNMPAGIKLLNFTISNDLKALKLQCKALSIRDISSFLNKLDGSKIYRNNNLINLSVAQKNVSQESGKGEGLVIKFEIESSVARDHLLANKSI
ncbi:MAG: PilN domain-containing protein [Deltaproteobacteria bacterium]|nr:PilN domain-containing protein [Deltaproteobacteria bacterium]